MIYFKLVYTVVSLDIESDFSDSHVHSYFISDSVDHIVMICTLESIGVFVLVCCCCSSQQINH